MTDTTYRVAVSTWALDHKLAPGAPEWAAFDAELANDPCVLAATVFTAGPMGWEDFEVDREMNDMINAHIQAQGGSYAPAAPSTPLTLGDLLTAEFGADYEDLSRSLPRHPTRNGRLPPSTASSCITRKRRGLRPGRQWLSTTSTTTAGPGLAITSACAHLGAG